MLSTDLISEHAAGLAALGRSHDLATPIPTCGEWDLATLVWHLAEVHHFWAYVIGNRPAGPDAYERLDRPPDGELADLLESISTGLVGLLDAADPAETAWSWSDDHTVAFAVRRQVHEAIVHHVDGVLAVGEALPDVHPTVAADGIDELITVMLAGVPGWAEYHPGGSTIRLTTTDAGTRHDLEFGRMTGTSPDTDRTYDIGAMRMLSDTASPTTSVSGPALSVELWMWGRAGTDDLRVEGDPAGAARLRELVVEVTQ